MTTAPHTSPTNVVHAPADRPSVLGPERHVKRILPAIHEHEAVEKIIGAAEARRSAQPKTGGSNDH